MVGEAVDGVEALERARALRPDVVLMDIRMPTMDGLEATRRLLADADPPRVLMLTTFDLDEYVYDALRAGASGFLLKDVPPEHLADAVRVVAAGDALLAPSITRRLVEQYRRRPRPGAQPRGLDALTDRELDVLRLVAHGRSNPQIADDADPRRSHREDPRRPSSRNSASATAPRPSSSPTKPASSSPATAETAGVRTPSRTRP